MSMIHDHTSHDQVTNPFEELSKKEIRIVFAAISKIVLN